MSNQVMWAVLAAAVLSFAGCDRGLSGTAAPQAGGVKPGAASTSPAGPDPSVPAAGTVVVSPEAMPAKAMPGTRSNAAMTRAEESNSMPMGGQVNDHSAPLRSAKGASAP